MKTIKRIYEYSFSGRACPAMERAFLVPRAGQARRLNKYYLLVVILAWMTLHARSIIASDSSTQPAENPAKAQLSQWITQLADDDPDVRQSAAQSLMMISSDQLPL